jgi:ribosomal protein S18 acetylase RimI-like enzyme
VPGFIGFLTRAYPLIRIKEAEADEFFIAHVAVVPAHQGHGLGASLLSHAEGTARDQGFNRISLTVEVENERAVSFYLRTGFNLVETVRVEELRKRIGYGGFHRMRKVLP